MAKHDGGPAFPQDVVSDITGVVLAKIPGMSLRDYFAAKVLQSELARNEADNINEGRLAGWVYKMADAMLAERNKP